MRARENWENVTAIVILLRVLAKMRKCHLLSSDRERAEISALTFVVKKKKYNEVFRGVYFSRIGEKNLK